MYRVGGDLKKVIRSIKRINEFKKQLHTPFPYLIFQFIPMAGNIQEIDQAALLARMLDTLFEIRLNRYPEDMSDQGREKIRKYAGYADRHEYLRQEKRHYFRRLCPQLWINPRIGWDGRIVGCSCNNNYGYFPGNVFHEDLADCLNSETMVYAREMLMGRRPPRQDVPCVRCECYQAMGYYENWMTEEEVMDRQNLIKKDFA